jgi:hypothetical protein
MTFDPIVALGLVLFEVLLAPGLACVLRHERVVPARSHTAFRETLRVVFVSVACLDGDGATHRRHSRDTPRADTAGVSRRQVVGLPPCSQAIASSIGIACAYRKPCA